MVGHSMRHPGHNGTKFGSMSQWLNQRATPSEKQRRGNCKSSTFRNAIYLESTSDLHPRVSKTFESVWNVVHLLPLLRCFWTARDAGERECCKSCFLFGLMRQRDSLRSPRITLLNLVNWGADFSLSVKDGRDRDMDSGVILNLDLDPTALCCTRLQ